MSEKEKCEKILYLKACVARGFELVRSDCSNQTLLLEPERGRGELIGGGSASEAPALLYGLYVRVFLKCGASGRRRDLGAQLGAHNLWFICSFSPQYDKPFTRRSLCR